jgi:hypothetical protein
MVLGSGATVELKNKKHRYGLTVDAGSVKLARKLQNEI